MVDSLAELAREAYAQGWAASGGPMTDRVRAGCLAAVRMAVRHANEPGVLEATLHLGHLEGVWAHIYARRDELHDQNRAAVAKVWRPMVADLDLPTLVRHVRHEAGLREAAPLPLSKALIGRIVDMCLNLINQVRHSVDWRQLRDTVRDALARGRAEGRADALALAADKQHLLTLDFDLAFEEAYQALANSRDLIGETDEWLIRIVGDQASELGRHLATLTRDGASYEDMLTAARDLLDTADPEAVGLTVDTLTARALSQGALDLYRSQDVRQADFLTAGDARVCPVCSEIEANNPHDLNSLPIPPRHPRCRCTVAAVNPLNLSAFAHLLQGG